MSLTRPAVLAALWLALAADASAAKRKPPPDVVEDALAYATTDRDRAITLLENALADGADADVVELYLAEQLRLADRPADARVHAVAVLGRAQGFDRDAAAAEVALLDAEGGADAAAMATLAGADERALLATQNADRALLLAVKAAAAGDAKEVSAWSKKALTYAKEDPAVRARVEAAMERLARGETAPPEPAAPAQEPIDAAEAAYEAGDRQKALDLARKALAKDPADARAQGLVKALEGRAEDPATIVVLLPASGKFEAVGGQVRQALEFGFGVRDQLVFVDSGSTGELAAQALEKAVLETGAVAIVGPILTDETDAVVAKAEALHVPLLSLSQSYDDTTGHHWALQGMYTRGDQIEALLDYVTRERRMDGFAIFHPDNEVGTRAAEVFQREAAERSATVTTSASYSAESTSLVEFARKLGTRVGNLAQLRAEAAANGGNPNTVVLPPKIDFDAIFLPESAQRTPLACAALAYEEFPMGDFNPKKLPEKIPLLGLSQWNVPSLVTQGNEYTRGSLFTDVFSAAVAGEADPFVVAYRQATGRTPTALEAAVVDAGKLLAAATASHPATRPAFRSALLSAQVTSPITGMTAIDPETLRGNRKMYILTITRTAIDDVAVVPVGKDP